MTRDALYEPLGNGTEVSLFKWLQGADIPVHELIKMKTNPLLHLPFDSRHGRSIFVTTSDTNTNEVRVYVKGEPELIIKASTHYHSVMNHI